MSSVIISGDTSGSITLSAPAVAGTNTITLPASTGTVLTTGSPQSGGVIQVVQGTTVTGTSTTSTSFVTTNLTASITPKFSTSKILAMVNGGEADTNASGVALITSIYRNSTILGASYGLATTAWGASSRLQIGLSLAYLDSPATTSATSYTLYIRSSSGGNVTFEANAPTCVITLMEIAA